MKPATEAFYLPALFVTVALAGGARIADRIVLVQPPLFTLVLALLWFAVLARSGAIALPRVMNGGRTAIANLNGLTLLLTTFAASAQIFNLVTPEVGLPRVLWSVFLFVLLLNTLVAATDRQRVLRSFLVIFGSAFILKFIVLAELSDPTGGPLKRVLMALFEGVTLGSVTQPLFHESTGYVAFFTIAIFMTGVALLPSGYSDISQDVALNDLSVVPGKRC